MGDIVLQQEVNPGALGANLAAFYVNLSNHPCIVLNDGVERQIDTAAGNDRSVSGNFSVTGTTTLTGNTSAGNLTVSGVLTGNLTGNASGNSGTATSLLTARNIDGQSFNGTANITVIAPGTHAAANKATLVDADEFPVANSAGSFSLVKATWANIKTGIQALTDTLYATANIQQNAQTANYTTVLTDAGKQIYHPVGDANRTYTIDSNANVAYTIGTTLTFVNDANSVTIAINADTMVLAGGSSTGSRTLTATGVATALKVTSTRWVIAGTGLT